MKLGLIGKPLGHSWSPEIHKFLIGEDYRLQELEENELAEFLRKRDFDGINVTIPYKEDVIKHLDVVDDAAERIGAVNCIVNREGVLTGYNTDCTGLLKMMRRRLPAGLKGRAAVLGTGGAAKAAAEACRSMGIEYSVVSRSEKEGCITYEELYEDEKSYALLINATPVGMYPGADEMPADLEKLKSLRYVIDIVANPVRTRLAYEAARRGIGTCGGFEMLVSQALAADEIFLGRSLDESMIDKCMSHILSEKLNLVLIGMPSSGKTTLGRIISDKTGLEFRDSDDVITERIGMPIPEFFEKKGESEFRRIETEVCMELSKEQGKIMATGGGAVESEENMRRLSYNGLLVYLDTPMELLTPTESRPLSADTDKLRELYVRRLPLYRRYADISIDNSRGSDTSAEEIIKSMQDACEIIQGKDRERRI